VLNADCTPLMQAARDLQPPHGKYALFALDDAHPDLGALRAQGGSTCGVAHGRMMLSHEGERFDLGAVNAMPLTVGGAAAYNVANAAAAALVALHLGVDPPVVASVLARFGESPQDNPGRLNHLRIGGSADRPPIHVLIDYAHNPEGLAGLLAVAQPLRQPGSRLGLLLGQAGNRSDADIAALAAVAASARPERVALKELPSMLRGRQLGEVPALLHAALLTAGVNAYAISAAGRERDQAGELLSWAKPGDVLVLPLHESGTSAQAVAWLTVMQGPGLPVGDIPPMS
jgi:cyanophycin synthetase